MVALRAYASRDLVAVFLRRRCRAREAHRGEEAVEALGRRRFSSTSLDIERSRRRIAERRCLGALRFGRRRRDAFARRSRVGVDWRARRGC